MKGSVLFNCRPKSLCQQGGSVDQWGSVSGTEHCRRSSCHQASEERRGAERNLHQASFTKQSCWQNALFENRRQDFGGRSLCLLPEWALLLKTSLVPSQLGVCRCRALTYVLPVMRMQSVPLNRLRALWSSLSRACRLLHGYEHTINPDHTGITRCPAPSFRSSLSSSGH